MIPIRQRLQGSTAILCLAAIFFSGCHRSYYRQQADAEAYALIQEKINDSRWQLPEASIEIDPQSRMYDPFNIDCPPMPPDDPASNELMQYVGGQQAWDGWRNNGVLTEVENPRWRSMLPRNENNKLMLDMDSAVQMALIHAPEFQNELEDLYLSALDVSFERFQFDVQYFAGKSGFFEFAGKDSSRGDSSTSFGFSTFSQPGGNSWQKRKLFATGAQLVVGLANSLIWEFSGPDDHSALTLLDFSIVQPLLRGGGRDIVLENLTQTERALLANVRQMERFRRAFYVEVATGRGANDGPNRGGPNVNGFTNTAGGAGGFLGLVQTRQDIRNQRSNIAALQSSVSQLQAFFEAGRIDFFQVEFARQALFSAQSRLLGTERGLQAALDNFKITLGLPPDIDIELEDDIIGPFQLVDPDIIPLQNGLTVLQQQAGQTMSRLFATAVEPALEKKKQSRSDDQQDESATDTPPSDDLVSDDDLQVDPSNSTERDGSADELPPAVAFQDGPAERFEPDEVNLDPPTLDWSPSVKKELTDLQQQLERTLDLLSEARDTHMDVARQDTERLKSAIQPRARIAALLKSQIRDRLERTRGGSANKVTETDIAALLPYDPSELNGLPKALNKTISQVGTELDDTERRLEKLISKIDSLLEGGDSLDPEELYEQIQTELRTSVPNELNEFSATILSLTLVQARARTESATLPTIELEWQQAIDQARTNRLDWMNARAQLVDTWRTIQFTARDLESQLDISLSGGIGNVGDNPLDIRWDSGQIRFGVEFDAPITRLAERNTYRQSLIDYQRARRDYYRFEDGVAVSLRDIIRRLEINQINFELQRAAVKVAISQVELARLRLQEPPRPNEAGGLGATTARDLVSALQGLLGAQNDFLNVWINQEALRRFLDLDMGTMQLDGTGLWIDPGPTIGQSAISQATDTAFGNSGEIIMEAPVEPDDPMTEPPPLKIAPPAFRERARTNPALPPKFKINRPFVIPMSGQALREQWKPDAISGPKPQVAVKRYATPIVIEDVTAKSSMTASLSPTARVSAERTEPVLFKIQATDPSPKPSGVERVSYMESLPGPVHSEPIEQPTIRIKATPGRRQMGGASIRVK